MCVVFVKGRWVPIFSRILFLEKVPGFIALNFPLFYVSDRDVIVSSKSLRIDLWARLHKGHDDLKQLYSDLISSTSEWLSIVVAEVLNHSFFF